MSSFVLRVGGSWTAGSNCGSCARVGSVSRSDVTANSGCRVLR